VGVTILIGANANSGDVLTRSNVRIVVDHTLPIDLQKSLILYHLFPVNSKNRKISH